MTDIREQVREQERDILTMNDEDLISEVRKGHMAVAGFVRSHGSEASKHECLRAFEAFDELADRLRRYRPMPLTDVPVAPAGQAGIEETEREKIVAWLRSEAKGLDAALCFAWAGYYRTAADAIERGWHLSRAALSTERKGEPPSRAAASPEED